MAKKIQGEKKYKTKNYAIANKEQGSNKVDFHKRCSETGTRYQKVHNKSYQKDTPNQKSTRWKPVHE